MAHYLNSQFFSQSLQKLSPKKVLLQKKRSRDDIGRSAPVEAPHNKDGHEQRPHGQPPRQQQAPPQSTANKSGRLAVSTKGRAPKMPPWQGTPPIGGIYKINGRHVASG